MGGLATAAFIPRLRNMHRSFSPWAVSLSPLPNCHFPSWIIFDGSIDQQWWHTDFLCSVRSQGQWMHYVSMYAGRIGKEGGREERGGSHVRSTPWFQVTPSGMTSFLWSFPYCTVRKRTESPIIQPSYDLLSICGHDLLMSLYLFLPSPKLSFKLLLPILPDLTARFWTLTLMFPKYWPHLCQSCPCPCHPPPPQVSDLSILYTPKHANFRTHWPSCILPVRRSFMNPSSLPIDPVPSKCPWLFPPGNIIYVKELIHAKQLRFISMYVEKKAYRWNMVFSHLTNLMQ